MPKGNLYKNFENILVEHALINEKNPKDYKSNIKKQIENEKEAVNDYNRMIRQVKVANDLSDLEKKQVIKAIEEIRDDEEEHIKKLKLLQQGKIKQAVAMS